MMFFKKTLEPQNELRAAMTAAYRMDEATHVENLLATLAFSKKIEKDINKLATEMMEFVRQQESEKSGVEALMIHYDLSTEEGIMLMCLAEALLRVPDKETENLLIRDKLTSADWQEHLGRSESAFVNAATWGLALTGKILQPVGESGYIRSLWSRLVQRSSEPVIRQAVRECMKVMSQQFVIGRTIKEALKNSQTLMKKGYLFSYDMLGEVARTQADADAYFASYQKAIETIAAREKRFDLIKDPSISVKLSALYPRYEFNHYESAIPILSKRLKDLVLLAKEAEISLTVDAEEVDRLDMSLDIFEAVFSDPELKGWEGLGLAVQAYQKRALCVVDWLIDLASRHKKRIQVRLVKGAYWDTEIKLSQVGGFDGYPVFTRKSSTDVSYLACAKRLLTAQKFIYPQFATHNAYSVAAVIRMMGKDYHRYQFEFQNLQGMGKALHDQIVNKEGFNIPCRVYAPVGNHEDLLPYLVRRLLENGANSSFVNQVTQKDIPIETLVESPVEKIKKSQLIPNPSIPLPRELYGEERINSSGLDFSHYNELMSLRAEMMEYQDILWQAGPLHHLPIDLDEKSEHVETVHNPANHQRVVGYVSNANEADIEKGLQQAESAFKAWDGKGPEERSEILQKAADLLEENRPELMMLLVREAGKHLLDAVSEIREAVDFCRYYSQLAKQTLLPERMPGPTGETNDLRLHGRGVVLCISPWNFPIAIFTGQVAAALVTGNTVIAKPAEQTPLVAARVVQLFHEVGIPEEVLQLMPGRGEVVGEKLVADSRVNAVIFTGSTETAKVIQKSLANRSGAVVPFIAETGGINAMIADSTALLEQLVADVLLSAFGSAGQRCSALRVLFLQDDIAEDAIEMLRGAMAELVVGDPKYLATDVGPIIDADAQAMLNVHAEKLSRDAKLIYRVRLPEWVGKGCFVAPQAYELPGLSELNREVFGPILHVIRYRRENLDQLIEEINGLGYGLTFGIQSRIDETVDYIQKRMRVGNIYVNRNMIGAVVGVQPFGGQGLSGTGPKAGGPHYLTRLCTESTLTINTTAAGGNASLMALSDD